MANPKPGPQRQQYPYETVEQYSESESQEPIPTPNTRALRRRMTMLLFISIVVLTVLVALWRTLHFSLPLPDFPFKMSGSLAPSCALQQLLHAARLVFRVCIQILWCRSFVKASLLFPTNSTDSAAYDYGGGCLRFAQRELPLAATQVDTTSGVCVSACVMYTCSVVPIAASALVQSICFGTQQVGPWVISKSQRLSHSCSLNHAAWSFGFGQTTI